MLIHQYWAERLLAGFPVRDPALREEGLDVRSWDLPSLRSQAMLLRADDVIAGTIADNVRMGRSEVPAAEVQQALAALEDAARYYLQLHEFSTEQIIETALID